MFLMLCIAFEVPALISLAPRSLICTMADHDMGMYRSGSVHARDCSTQTSSFRPREHVRCVIKLMYLLA